MRENDEGNRGEQSIQILGASLTDFDRKLVVWLVEELQKTKGPAPEAASAGPENFDPELDTFCGIPDHELTERFRWAVVLANLEKRIKGAPIARYGAATKQAYLEYPDGTREVENKSGGYFFFKDVLTSQKMKKANTKNRETNCAALVPFNIWSSRLMVNA